MSDITVKVKFPPRELEFIKLRYQDELPYKDVAVAMNVSLRTVHFYAANVYMRLNVTRDKGNEGPSAIRATKLLIRHGYVEC
jgi:DNA-binding NarL/FixJ family response regulator